RRQPCSVKPGGVRYRIDGFVNIPFTPYDEYSLKKAVARQPVAVTMFVGKEFQQLKEVVT
ncbi:hypothetical protein A2U01_0117736, partial [Trifolium medium]|nr:hypothetical protein [Trifolium medium]